MTKCQDRERDASSAHNPEENAQERHMTRVRVNRLALRSASTGLHADISHILGDGASNHRRAYLTVRVIEKDTRTRSDACSLPGSLGHTLAIS